MTRPHRRRGLVADHQGAPLADVLVSVAWSDVPAPEIAARTDARGTFNLGLPPGDFELVAHRDGREIARRRVRLGGPAAQDEVELRLDAEGDGRTE